MQKISNKIRNNLKIYKKDLITKGLYWSIVHRLYRYPAIKKVLTPIVNILKPDFYIANNHKFYIDKEDSIVSEVLLSSKVWEEYETEIFKENVHIGETVVDVGAHIGYYTLIAASIVGNKGKVYAFEPDPRNFQLLKKNVREFGCTNVVLINKAVSNINGDAILYLNNENSGDHRVYNTGDKRRTIKITTITLDDYFKDKKTKIDLIKMDIQGAEVQAMTGAVEILNKNKNIKLITELMPSMLKQSGSSIEKYLELLKENKFKISRIDEMKRTTNIITPESLIFSYRANEDFLTNLLCFR